MKFPLRSTVQIGRYVATQKRKGELYPLVLMLEPTLACNLACIGCGKIREYESNKARLSVDECIDAGVQCPAPVVSICGGEPLIYKGIEDVVAGMLELRKNIDLCTNALKLTEYLDVFKPDPRLTFVVHLDGMREIHDYVCDYPGLWDIAVDAIKQAREAGLPRHDEHDDLQGDVGRRRDRDDGLPDERGRDRRDADRAGVPVLADRPGADDDARRARGEVPRDPRGGAQARLPLAGEPDLPGLPHRRPRSSRARRGARSRATRTAGRARATCSRTGSSRRTTRCSRTSSGRRTGPGNDPRCEHCGIHSGFEPSAAYAATVERQGDRAEHGVDADGMTLRLRDDLGGARRAKRAGFAHGARRDRRAPRRSRRATSSRSASPAACRRARARRRRSTRRGRRRGRRRPLGGRPARRPGARPGTILAVDRHRRRPGRAPPPARARPARTRSTWRPACWPRPAGSRGCVRAISDTPERPLGPLAAAVDAGRPAAAVRLPVARSCWHAARARAGHSRDVRRALWPAPRRCAA